MLEIRRLIVLVFGISALLPEILATSNDTEVSYSGITAWVEGTKIDSGEPMKIFFSENSDTEIVLRDLKDVSVHCEAEFPVHLEFKSHGRFKLLATGSGSSSKSFSNETHTNVVQKHTTYAHLVSLKEAYTGQYICQGRSSQTNNNTISAFIYVPTEKLFVSTKTATLSSFGQSHIAVPCPVSDPNATVWLVKLHGKNSFKPVTTATYNPRLGFSIVHNGTVKNSSHDSDAEEETYYCIAQTNQVHRAVEFTIVDGPVSCTQRCLENSKCQLVNDQQVCECKPTYTETLVSEKCLLECITDKDCPEMMACVPQESDSFLLDILSSVEGRTSTLEDAGQEEHHIKRGECKNPCIFRTTSCSLGASPKIYEECHVEEHKALCGASNAENHHNQQE